MSESYLMSMPILIYNLGGEMLYILCSRLKAQKIAGNKSSQVIHDVVATLFNEKCLTEMSKHDKIHTHQQVRKFFEKLAHSSIMRLNSTSMSKLFELMLMTFKLELIRTRYPEEIYQITLNHLESIKEIIIKENASQNKENLNILNKVINDFKNIYGKLSIYDYIVLKSTLMRFLQGKNVKVSIFISDKLQSQKNILFLPMNEIAPPLVEKPGEIKIYDLNGKVINNDYFELKLTQFYKKNKTTERNKNFDTDLGLNMFSDKKPRIIPRDDSNTINKNNYETNDTPETKDIKSDEKEKEKEKVIKEEKLVKKIEEKKENIYESGLYEINRAKELNIKESELFGVQTKNKLPQNYQKILSESTKKEFNELADLLSVSNTNEKGTFKIDLFPSNKSHNNENDDTDYIEINREENIHKKINDAFSGLIGDTKDDNQNNEDDLLDLMDKAVQEDQ